MVFFSNLIQYSSIPLTGLKKKKKCEKSNRLEISNRMIFQFYYSHSIFAMSREVFLFKFCIVIKDYTRDTCSSLEEEEEKCIFILTTYIYTYNRIIIYNTQGLRPSEE